MRAAGVLVLFCVAVAYAQTQLSPIVGNYYSGCTPFPFTNPEPNVYARHSVSILNNVLNFRTSIFTVSGAAQCATDNFDIIFDHYGVYNWGLSPSNVAGATNFDVGQEYKFMVPVTLAGVTALDTYCTIPGGWQLNVGMPVGNIPCLGSQPFSSCSISRSIAVQSAQGLTVAVPTCPPAPRPTSFASTLPLQQYIPNYPIWYGLWQSASCFTPDGVVSYSHELSLHMGFMSFAFFGYPNPTCSGEAGIKGTMGGQWFVSYPNPAVPSAFDLELLRFSHSIYLTTGAGNIGSGSANFLATINAQTGACGFNTFSLGNLYDVSNITCPQLFWNSVATCPRIYQLISMQGGQLVMGNGNPSAHASLCVPANRPMTLSSIGSINMFPFPQGPPVAGVAVVMSLLLIGLVAGAVWIIFRHRGNTLTVMKTTCCGGGGAASYDSSA
eukprot:TRINITY_DN12818_c0_g1_i1.p1 TRINITY_DN12818_c0_g1~~TRINITY_DN12818_c0_g1_i1.p1  ORF type:complete len:440 (+),score=81.80 TRINITY_DN12818_c0_g1_i1:39-1358(+)